MSSHLAKSTELTQTAAASTRTIDEELIVQTVKRCAPESGSAVLIAQGPGTLETLHWLRETLRAALGNFYLQPLDVGTVLPPVDGPLIVSTESSTLRPLFFPGGDLGRLAVHSMVNRLAASGAEPLYFTLSLHAEEGLSRETLTQLLVSIGTTARQCGVPVVMSDARVVLRGQVDQLILTLTGLGRQLTDVALGKRLIRPGDRILISGPVGEHGLMMLSAQGGFKLESLSSDSSACHRLVADWLAGEPAIRWLGLPTSGGIARILQDVADSQGLTLVLEEEAIPVSTRVRGGCSLLGVDPMHLDGHGIVVAFVAPAWSRRALEKLRSHPLGQEAALVGEVRGEQPGVWLRGPLRTLRPLDCTTGLPLPRIGSVA